MPTKVRWSGPYSRGADRLNSEDHLVILVPVPDQRHANGRITGCVWPPTKAIEQRVHPTLLRAGSRTVGYSSGSSTRRRLGRCLYVPVAYQQRVAVPRVVDRWAPAWTNSEPEGSVRAHGQGLKAEATTLLT